MSKHTPGPWKAGVDIFPRDIVRGKDLIATTYGLGAEIEDEESLANARLIAAAPDLLAALYLLRDNSKETANCHRCESCASTARSTLAHIQMLIAKAAGA